MSTTDSLVGLAFGLAGESIRAEIEKEINTQIKELADKYATYFDVRWKTVCNESNNPQSVIDAHKIIVDVYIQVPALMSDYAKMHGEFTVTSTDKLP